MNVSLPQLRQIPEAKCGNPGKKQEKRLELAQEPYLAVYETNRLLIRL